jgi:MSHA pilin protein MshC
MTELSLRTKGFTLVELIMVLIVVGILSVYVAPRFANQGSFNTRSIADQYQSILRYAQKIAIAQQYPIYIVFSASGAAVCLDAACATPLLMPTGGKSATISLPPGVGAAISPQLSGFYFNALGRPFNSSDAYPTSTSTFSGLTITLTGGNLNRVITVEKETGYVHQ